MEFHPVAELFPLMSDDEFTRLCCDIAASGLREEIWTHEGKIIDGRNRFKACGKAGVEPRFREYEGDPADLVTFVVSLNLHRRHLSESQRAMVAERLTNLDRGRPDLNAPIGAAISQDTASKMLNVSRQSISRAAKVTKLGVPGLIEKVEAGEISVSRAADIAQLPRPKQMRIIKRGRKASRKVLNSLKIESLRTSIKAGAGCLHCNPDAEFNEATVSAFMQKLAFRSPKFASYFNDIVEELEQEKLSESTRGHYDRILDAVDRGFMEKSELQKAAGMDRDPFEATIALMLDYDMIEAVKQGGKTEAARGASKLLYRRKERVVVEELHYEPVADEF
jgi:hypothetical protein